jgi:N-methylhydantoinase B
LFSAGAGAKAQFVINDEAGDPSGLTLCQSGDSMQFQSAGGGGYGNPLERDPEAVAADVFNGYVSVERAKSDYGVVLDPGTFKLDPEETDKVRASRNKK